MSGRWNDGDFATPANLNHRANAPVYNVKDYGAAGDGSADDTSDVQSAIDDAASNGGVVHFPQGTYQVSGVTLKDDVTLTGEGTRVSEVKLADDSDVSAVLMSDDWRSTSDINAKITIRGLKINGNASSNTTAAGIAIQGFSSYLEEIDVRDCEGPGIWFRGRSGENGVENRLVATQVKSGNSHGVRLGQNASDSVLVSAHLGNNEGAQLFVEGATQEITGCHFFAGSTKSGKGMWCQGSGDIQMVGSIIESLPEEAVVIEETGSNVQGFQFSDNLFRSSGFSVDDSFDAISLETPNGNRIRNITIEGCYFRSSKNNQPRNLVARTGSGSVQGLNLAGSNFEDFVSSAVSLQRGSDLWVESGNIRDRRPLEQSGITNIAGTDSAKTVNIDTPEPDHVRISSHNTSEALWVNNTAFTEFEVQRDEATSRHTFSFEATTDL